MIPTTLLFCWLRQSREKSRNFEADKRMKGTVSSAESCGKQLENNNRKMYRPKDRCSIPEQGLIFATYLLV